MADTDWLIEGLTDMPEGDLRTIADFMAVPLHTVQGIVWFSEMYQRESAGGSE